MTRRSRRRPAARAVARTLLAITVSILWIILVPVQSALYGTPFPLAVILGTAMCAAPLLVITYMRTGVVLFWAATLLLPLSVSADPQRGWPWPWSVPAMLALAIFTVVITYVHGWRIGLIAMGAAIVGSVITPVLQPEGASPTTILVSLIVTAAVTPVFYLVAVLASSRVQVAAELTQERELSALEHSKRLLSEERTRIARELHDVVAHSLSVVQVQAATARYRLPELPDDAASEFDDLAQTAREALLEMRTLLGVLRTDDHVAPLTPQSGLSDIPDLIETFRRAGADVALSPLDALSASAPAAVQIAAFRIVQESVSNAVRHSAGAPITVAVHSDPGRTEVRVVNDAPASAPSDDRGHGLRGMRERATLLGGTLGAGPDGEGRWRVHAVLPWTRPFAEEESP